MRCNKRWCWRRAIRLRYHCPKHQAPPEAWNALIEQMRAEGRTWTATKR